MEPIREELDQEDACSLSPPESVNSDVAALASGEAAAGNTAATADLDSEEDEVSLPPSINSDGEPEEKGWQCCKRNCSSLFAEETLEAESLQQNLGTASEIQQRKFDLLRAVYNKNDEDHQKKGLQFFFQAERVCRKFWEHQRGVSPKTVDHWLKLCRAGQITLPKPGPKLGKATPQLERANLWFLEVYQLLADPLALPGSEDQYFFGRQEPLHSEQQPPAIVHETVSDTSHPLYGLSLNITPTKGHSSAAQVLAPRRHVNFSTLLDFFRFYCSDVAPSEQVSRTTWERGYNTFWARHLILKSPTTGNKCSVCLGLDEKRTNSTSEAERFAVDQEKMLHLETVKADRSVNTRGNLKCSDLKNFQPNFQHTGCVKIMIDGMDQQKFSMPRARRLQGASEYGKAWKTNVHVTGVVIWGVEEQYYLLPMDLPKSSSMECTILAKALDETKKRLKEIDPSYDLPCHLIVAVDNTPREAKNQYFAQFCAYLSCKHFASVQVEFLQVSHTHNELDQRFSSVASLIKRCDELQSIDQLQSYLQAHMRPAQGSSLSVHVLDNHWSFSQWFAGQTSCQLSGLTATKLQPHANHLWRFSRREILEQELIQNNHDEWALWPENPLDICMQVKQYISSPEMSQAPEVIMPYQVYQKLSKNNLAPSSLNKFAPTTLQEFRKTAELVGKPPWNLLEGQSYLLDLCERNEAGVVPKPPDLFWVFSFESQSPRLDPVIGPALLLEDLPPPENAPPRPIRVGAKKMAMKRPAAGPALPARPIQMKRPASSTDLPAGGLANVIDLEVSDRPSSAAAAPSAVAKSKAAASAEAKSQPSPKAGGVKKMRRPAAAVEKPPGSADAIRALPGFECFGCSKCRKKQTPKIGCQLCRGKAEAGQDGFHCSPEGWIYRLEPQNVD